MPKDIDDLNKQLDKMSKKMNSNDNLIEKDLVAIYKQNAELSKEISNLKKEVADMAFKIDTMLEILNNFTIMLAEDDEDLADNYDIDDADESWVPKDEEFWDDDEDEES